MLQVKKSFKQDNYGGMIQILRDDSMVKPMSVDYASKFNRHIVYIESSNMRGHWLHTITENDLRQYMSETWLMIWSEMAH